MANETDGARCICKGCAACQGADWCARQTGRYEMCAECARSTGETHRGERLIVKHCEKARVAMERVGLRDASRALLARLDGLAFNSIERVLRDEIGALREALADSDACEALMVAEENAARALRAQKGA
jgi:hypothetical protein